MGIRAWAAAAALSVCAWAGSATAAIVTVTWTGHVLAGDEYATAIDYTGIFGPAGANLAGAAYKAVFVFDTSIGYSKGPHYEQVSGGPGSGTPSPSRGATLTINGVTYSFSGSSGGYAADRSDTSGLITQADSYSDPDSGLGEGIVIYALRRDDGLPGTINVPYSHDFTAGDEFASIFQILTEPGPTNARLDFDNYTIAVVSSAVPEPSTWAMMLIGFAGLGFVARRKRIDQSSGCTENVRIGT